LFGTALRHGILATLEDCVKATILVRIASVLTLVHCVLHTIGGVFGSPSHGAEEIAVVESMKLHRFAVMGSLRSYWDFFFGYGLFVSVSLLALAVLLWQLSTLTKTNAVQTRPMLVVLCLCFLGFTVVSWNYFFVAPAVVEVLIALFIGLACVATPAST
jgi:hypothetical protein